MLLSRFLRNNGITTKEWDKWDKVADATSLREFRREAKQCRASVLVYGDFEWECLEERARILHDEYYDADDSRPCWGVYVIPPGSDEKEEHITAKKSDIRWIDNRSGANPAAEPLLKERFQFLLEACRSGPALEAD